MKNIEKFKDEFAKAPGKYTAGFAILCVIAFICLYSITGAISISSIWPDENAINASRKRLADSQSSLLEALNENYRLKERRKLLARHSKDFWLKERDGDPVTTMKEIVDKAAGDSGFTLSSVGAARSTNVADGITVVSLRVLGEGTFEEAVGFISAIEKAKPALYWKNIYLRPRNRKQMFGNISLKSYIQVEVITKPEVLELFSDAREK